MSSAILAKSTSVKAHSSLALASNLGDAYLAIGDIPAATQAWRQSLAVFTELAHDDADQVKAKLARLKEHFAQYLPGYYPA